jgi:hypothetical protein
LILVFRHGNITVDTVKGGPSTANRDLSASVDPATFTEEATQGTEDQIGLDKGKRRDVQRRLTDLASLWSVPASSCQESGARILRCSDF